MSSEHVKSALSPPPLHPRPTTASLARLVCVASQLRHVATVDTNPIAHGLTIFGVLLCRMLVSRSSAPRMILRSQLKGEVAE